MRISRKKRPEKPLIVHYRKNLEIASPQVMLLDENNKNLGVFSNTPPEIKNKKPIYSKEE